MGVFFAIGEGVQKSMVPMSIWSVSVAVFLFFLSCVANLEDLDIKVKRFARERMIAVDFDFVAFDAFHGENHALAFADMGLELHSGFELSFGRELGALHAQAERWIDLAVAFGRSDGHLLLGTDSQTFESGFKTWDNLA